MPCWGGALAGRDEYPFEEAAYRDAREGDFEVAVKLAGSRSEMEEEARLPKPEKTAEALPWAEAARASLAEEDSRARGAGTNE